MTEVFNTKNRQLSPSTVGSLLRRFLSADEVAGFEVNMPNYQRALVHQSYSVEDGGKLHRANRQCPHGCMPLQGASYERLEYLGDAVLGLVTAAYLCERYPREDEGFLTRMRSKLVNGRMLTRLCHKHTPLPANVVVGNSTPAASVLDDVFEAFLGAMFVDRGFDACKRWIVGFLEENVDFAELVAELDDDKSVLNRMYMRSYGYVPLLEKLSDTTVRLMTPSGTVISTGIGSTVKDAHDIAVRNTLKLLKKV